MAKPSMPGWLLAVRNMDPDLPPDEIQEGEGGHTRGIYYVPSIIIRAFDTLYSADSMAEGNHARGLVPFLGRWWVVNGGMHTHLSEAVPLALWGERPTRTYGELAGQGYARTSEGHRFTTRGHFWVCTGRNIHLKPKLTPEEELVEAQRKAEKESYDKLHLRFIQNKPMRDDELMEMHAQKQAYSKRYRAADREKGELKRILQAYQPKYEDVVNAQRTTKRYGAPTPTQKGA